MPHDFLMPKLGLTMEEGTIVEWLVANGSMVRAGDAVLAIETDKTETSVTVSVDGTLHHSGEVGQTYRCGEVIGWLRVGDEPDPLAPRRHLASPNARRLAVQLGIDLLEVSGTGPNGRVVGADVVAHRPAPRPAVPPTATPSPGRQPATVAARQLADLLGVDLAAVSLDPIEHAVTRESVARYVRERLREQPVLPVPTTPAVQTPVTTRPLTGMRGTIAKRMHQSLTQMAQLTLHMDADMGPVVEHRRRQRASSQDSGQRTPTLTDYVLAATARALREHPSMNSRVEGSSIVTLADVHLGLAVALDDGLVVPVIRHADTLGLDALAAESARLADRARSKALGPDDMEGGTFSVTTLGSLGVDGFTPIINPPNAGILGVGRLHDEVISIDGAITVVQRLTLSLTWDHRVLDGAPAARFCRSVVESLGLPETLE